MADGDIPEGTSWVNNLPKSEAQKYCERFGLSTEGTLDQIRARMRIYCRGLESESEERTRSSVRMESLLENLVKALTTKENPSVSLSDLSKCASRKGLVFSGNVGEGVTAFLEACADFQCTKGVSDELMWRLTPDLLDGSALKWFRVNRSSFLSFSDFKTALRATYLPANYEMRLKKDLFKRTQGMKERMSEYVTCIATMNGRLNRALTDPELVELAYCNLNPVYRKSIPKCTFSNLNELMLAGRAVEETLATCDLYQAPPAPSEMVDPEFGVEGEVSKNSHFVMSAARPAVEASSGGLLKCWNCGSLDHYFRRCKKALRKFCRRCGQAGETVVTCRCSGNGNEES
jgi:hypothetical protein